jgi:hypothetical protein
MTYYLETQNKYDFVLDASQSTSLGVFKPFLGVSAKMNGFLAGAKIIFLEPQNQSKNNLRAENRFFECIFGS